MELHPIMPGTWCVPAAIQCLTGADLESVIQPALNRHGQCSGLLDLVTGATMTAAQRTLEELKYRVRRYKHKDKRKLKTWAAMSLSRYPGRALLVAVQPRRGIGHALVVKDGRVFDTWTPHGENGDAHPYSGCVIRWCALIEAA